MSKQEINKTSTIIEKNNATCSLLH